MRAYLKVYCGYGNNKFNVSVSEKTLEANGEATNQIINYICYKRSINILHSTPASLYSPSRLMKFWTLR